MSAINIPFNLDLLILTPASLKMMRPVSNLGIFTGNSHDFHPDGLFSIETFGRVGEERRSRAFSYIDLKASVFHPLIFRTLTKLKQLYQDIMAGTTYAVWNEESKDFETASATEGETGYSFFLRNFPEMVFESRASDRREFNIKLVDKYRDQATLTKLLVMPAGLRDYEVDDQGKPSEDEINSLYRKVLAMANLIDPVGLKISEDMADATRYSMQLAVLEIYEYIENMLQGKKKLINAKWASRRVRDSTRNVITSQVNEVTKLDDEKAISINQTVVGLYQYLKSTMPVSSFQIRNKYLSLVFQGPNLPAILVNAKTLKKEMVQLDPDYYDDWMTSEGLEKTITKFSQEDIRHEPIMINGHCLGLIYLGDWNGEPCFKFMQGISELPEGYDRSKVRPISFVEFLYISVFAEANQMPGFITRYPITGYGGIYPSYVYLRTTVNAETRKELGDDWMPTGKMAYQFPIRGGGFINSMSLSTTNLQRLDADHDGDTVSLNCVFTEEAQAEVKRLLNSRSYYVGVNGKMNFSSKTDTLTYVLSSMTD